MVKTNKGHDADKSKSTTKSSRNIFGSEFLMILTKPTANRYILVSVLATQMTILGLHSSDAVP